MNRRLSRRSFLKTAGAAGTVALIGLSKKSGAQSTGRKPNLLFILADDHAGYVLGVDGNKQARTPNLDRLASEGTRFAANYCNSPVCTPSRQCILTGQYPHSAGVTVLSTALADEKPTLAKQLSASGYKTAVFGKMHFNKPGTPGLHGFDQAWTEDVINRTWTQEVGPLSPLPEGITTTASVAGGRGNSTASAEPSWLEGARRTWNARDLPFPQMDAKMRGTWQVEKAFEWAKEHKDGPFAMWLSFMEPHQPFVYPIEDRTAFDPRDLPLPQLGPDDPAQVPVCFSGYTLQEKQNIIAAYHTSVSFMDRNIGRALAQLKALGLEDNTLVVYMADHGYSLGQHGRFEKHTCFEPALRVPLMMRYPGKISKRVVTDFTESVDVPHTILDLLGMPPFDVQHGQSLKPYLEGRRVQNPRQEIFSEYLENEEACLRNTEWKLVQCSGRRARRDGYAVAGNNTPGRYYRLFDLRADPNEFHNVTEKHPEVVKKLSEIMLARYRATHPEAQMEPPKLATADAIDWYLRPRDTGPSTGDAPIFGAGRSGGPREGGVEPVESGRRP